MTRLSDTQTCLLSAAANRDDRSLLPPPDGLKARGGALQRTLAALLRRGLIAVVSVRGTDATWRTEEDGRRTGLAATDAGLAAIGIDLAPAPANGGRKAKGTETPQASAKRPKGKLNAVLSSIEANGGATLDDLTTATGWLPHTTRAAITRLRQRGFAIELAGEKGARRYRIAAEAA